MPFDNVNLGDGLVLHPVRTVHDAASFIALNEAVTGEGYLCERLLQHHPGTTLDHFFGIEDTEKGEFISTTCLIPWQLDCDGVRLSTAMLEMVVTHPGYRRRGLIRAQVNRFHQKALDDNYDLCIIQGIPYYYRQYGYGYALDHTPFDTLESQMIPEMASNLPAPYSLRSATLDDAGVLTELYQLEMRRHALVTQRGETYWRYLLRDAHYPLRVVEDADSGRVVGYLCVEASEKQPARIVESAIGNHEQGLAVFRWLKAEYPGDIQIAGSERTTLVRIARSLGSRREPSGQWLVRVPSFSRLLLAMGPVLEHRLSDADCGGLTIGLTLNLYREALKLEFVEGKLRAVDSLGFLDTSMGAGASGGDLWIPPDAFIRLLLGYRDLDDLLDAWPDIVVTTHSRYLWEALFPKMDSLIFMPY